MLLALGFTPGGHRETWHASHFWLWLSDLQGCGQRQPSPRGEAPPGTADCDYDLGQISELLIMSSMASRPKIRECLATKYMFYQTSLKNTSSRNDVVSDSFLEGSLFQSFVSGHVIHSLLSLQCVRIEMQNLAIKWECYCFKWSLIAHYYTSTWLST